MSDEDELQERLSTSPDTPAKLCLPNREHARACGPVFIEYEDHGKARSTQLFDYCACGCSAYDEWCMEPPTLPDFDIVTVSGVDSIPDDHPGWERLIEDVRGGGVSTS